jgi:hypothetical protein
MLPWTSKVLCDFAQLMFSHRKEILELDPDEPIDTILERINALASNEPKLMLLNVRVETDLGLLVERLVEGQEPPEGDDGFHPLYRLVYGRLGSKTCLLPYFPQEPPESEEYRLRFAVLLEAMEDGTHPNLLRQVALPLRGARTYAAITFYKESAGPRLFARFAWRKDMQETDAVWLLKDAWVRWRTGQHIRRPPTLDLPS